MSVDMIADGQYLAVKLDQWDITAHWVISPEGMPYLAIARQCAELGVAFQSQMAKLSADDAMTDDILRPFIIETGGGRQATKCIRKPEAALWIAGINPAKVKKELRAKMADIRAGILMAADRIVFGDYTGVMAISSPPARGGDLHLGGCPRCHAQLAAHVGPDGIALSIVGE